MTPGVPTRMIAAALGLSAFSVAVIAGLAAENPTETILLRAVVSMLACNAAGWVVGAIAERTVMEAVRQYEREQLPVQAGPREVVEESVVTL